MKKYIVLFLTIVSICMAGQSMAFPPTMGGGSTSCDNTAYNATSWNNDATYAPCKDAVRDKIESISVASQASLHVDNSPWDCE